MINVPTINQSAFYKHLLVFAFFMLPFLAFSQLQLNISEDTSKYKIIEASKKYDQEAFLSKKMGNTLPKRMGNTC